jgi:hypothetical protein
MPQPQLKTDPKPKDKSPKLVKGNGKAESAAVKNAKEKKLEVQPKFDAMKTKENPAIQAKALELKKVQKARVQLSNEETRLNAELVELMKAAKFTVYDESRQVYGLRG